VWIPNDEGGIAFAVVLCFQLGVYRVVGVICIYWALRRILRPAAQRIPFVASCCRNEMKSCVGFIFVSSLHGFAFKLTTCLKDRLYSNFGKWVAFRRQGSPRTYIRRSFKRYVAQQLKLPGRSVEKRQLAITYDCCANCDTQTRLPRNPAGPVQNVLVN
jgi:hypothetical protein